MMTRHVVKLGLTAIGAVAGIIGLAAQATVAPVVAPTSPVFKPATRPAAAAPAAPTTTPTPVPTPARQPTATPAVPQQTPPPATPQGGRGQITPVLAARSSWQNVKLEFSITDQNGGRVEKKTVTMLVADNGTGRIRSTMQVRTPENGGGYQSIGINIDATVTLPVADMRTTALAGRGLVNGRGGRGTAGQILVNLTAQYTPEAPFEANGAGRSASLDESLNVVLEDGKPTLISQSADPQGERKVMLEVTATVQK